MDDKQFLINAVCNVGWATITLIALALVVEFGFLSRRGR